MQAPAHREVEAIGRDGIKQLRVSPDAFFHVAAHLAYYEKFKKIPTVHNFADMRGIKFGSITRYLSTTDEIVEFLRDQTRPALLDALDAHGKAMAVIRSGDYPLHYAYFYLYTARASRPARDGAVQAVRPRYFQEVYLAGHRRLQYSCPARHLLHGQVRNFFKAARKAASPATT